MLFHRISWGLLVGLWLASPQQGAWAGAPGRASWPLPALQVSNAGLEPSQEGFFSRDMVLGLVLTGSGAYFIKKGFDFRREADALYDRYLDTLDPDEITQLYQRTTKRDLKSALSWSLGAVLAVGGIRMVGRHFALFRLQRAPPFAQVRPEIRGTHLVLSRHF
jgi:hypothetical protein